MYLQESIEHGLSPTVNEMARCRQSRDYNAHGKELCPSQSWSVARHQVNKALRLASRRAGYHTRSLASRRSSRQHLDSQQSTGRNPSECHWLRGDHRMKRCARLDPRRSCSGLLAKSARSQGSAASYLAPRLSSLPFCGSPPCSKRDLQTKWDSEKHIYTETRR